LHLTLRPNSKYRVSLSSGHIDEKFLPFFRDKIPSIFNYYEMIFFEQHLCPKGAENLTFSLFPFARNGDIMANQPWIIYFYKFSIFDYVTMNIFFLKYDYYFLSFQNLFISFQKDKLSKIPSLSVSSSS